MSPTLESLVLPDGYRAAARWWLPPTPIAGVLYLHGIQSHGAWYEDSGRRLHDRQLAVLMPDRRGSGLNQEQRGHAASAEQCVDDAATALLTLLGKSGFSAAHVVGVSWGGKLAVALAAHCPRQVASLSLVAPGLFPRVDLTAAEKLRVALALMHGRERAFDIPISAPRMFTANPDRLHYLEGDDLTLRQVTAAFLLASRQLDRVVRLFGHSQWKGPMHLILAGRDQIVDNARTLDWFDALPHSDRLLTEYPEAEHTIEFEADPSRFLNDLTNWIARRGVGRDESCI